jgi:CCR4-NOT transcription complex subunit 4
MYLHEVAEDEISFTKEDMHQGKHTEYERRLQEQMTNGTNQTGGQAQQNPVSNSAIQNLADGKESTSATIVKSRINNKTADHMYIF